jgi:nuclear pore complex protein Nup160
MSVFTSFQLVHAHLPATPAAPGPVAEVSVPTDRPFPDDGEVYATPLHPDHAVSAAFEPRTGTLARTVYNGYALELRSLSPVVNRGKNIEEPTVVRIMFPDALRPLGDGCIVPSFGDRQLVVLALSTANVLYRFTFPLGLFADKGDRIKFAPKEAEWVEEWEIEPDTVAAIREVGSWAVTDENTVVIGGADGGIVRLVRALDSRPGKLPCCLL